MPEEVKPCQDACGFRRKPPTYSNLMPPIVLT